MSAKTQVLTHTQLTRYCHIGNAVCPGKTRFILTYFTVKYLGLLAMSRILKSHPKSVQAHKDLVLQCLDDKDESIRLRALDLLYGMVRAQFKWA